MISINPSDPKLASRLLKLRHRIRCYDSNSGVISYDVEPREPSKSKRALVALTLILVVMGSLIEFLNQGSAIEAKKCSAPLSGGTLSSTFSQLRKVNLGGVIQVTLANACDERFLVTLETKRQAVIAVKGL